MRPSVRKCLLKLRDVYDHICLADSTAESIQKWEDEFYDWLSRLSCQELLDLLEFLMRSRHLPPF